MSDTPVASGHTQDLIAAAIAYQQQGQPEQAEPLLRKALSQSPLDPDALHLLGLLEFKANRRQDGLDKMRRSVELMTRDASATRNASLSYSFGSALFTDGQYAEALVQYRRCVELEPDNGAAWQRLATSLCHLDRPEDAAESLKHALSQLPRHTGCWHMLSRIQKNLGLISEATTAARHAVEAAPEDPNTRVWLASLLLLTDQTREAAALLESAVAKQPQHVEARFERAKLLIMLGNFSEAQSELETVLALDPDFTHAYIRLASIGGLAAGSARVKALEARARQGERSNPVSQRNLHFALGRTWESAGDYACAFEHFAAANRLRRGMLHYSAAATRKRFEHIRTAADDHFLARAKCCGQQSSVPIFIVGMPRSGTSLVEQILSSHPDVHAGGELKLMSAALHGVLGPAYRHDPYGSPFGLGDDSLRKVGEDYLAHLRALAPSAPHITDKLPGNFLRLGLVHALYPEARIVHCVRDARDTCVSLFTTLLSSSHDYTSDLTELGGYYCEYRQLMQHWECVLPTGTVLDVRYEDVIEHTADQVRRLLAHCRLSWNPACLQFTGSRHPVRTASAYQVRKPIYPSSIGRWRHYAPYLGPLCDALKRQNL